MMKLIDESLLPAKCPKCGFAGYEQRFGQQKKLDVWQRLVFWPARRKTWLQAARAECLSAECQACSYRIGVPTLDARTNPK